MRQAALFLSRFLLSFWIVLVIAFLSLLLPNAPRVPDYACFASVSLESGNGTVYLPNRIFDCTETEQQFQCQTKIQDRLLELTLTKGSDYQYDFSSCRARYSKQEVGCREEGENFAPILSKMYKIADLELSPQQWREVQQKYWSINILMRLGEEQLLKISAALSLIAGISAVFFTWCHPGLFSKAFVSFTCGFGVSVWVWHLLLRIPFAPVTLTPHSFTLDTWQWIANGGAIAVGTAVMLLAERLWRYTSRTNPFKRFLSLGSSLGAAILTWYALLFTLLWLGYAD